MQSSKSSRALQVRLLHVQTTTLIEFPKNLTVIRIGKPDSNRLPDIDVTHLPNSDIVSRSQAEIRIQENAYFIQDLASANGTFLNGSRLTPYTSCQLRYGDRIDFGKDELFTFLFREAKRPKTPISSSRPTGNNFQASASRNLRVTSRGNGERNQRESSQHSAPNFNILAFILNGLTSTFRNLASFVSRQIKRFIKWLIRTVVKIGLIFIALFVIGLLGVLLIHGLTHAPAVVGSGSAGGGMPVVEIPVEAPVEQPVTQPPIKPPSIKLPQKRLVEPRRIRVPYTNENRPEGQASCDCPYDWARDWSLCGGRSAYVRPGGKEPACYVGETTARERWWKSSETAFVDRDRKGR